MVSVFNWKASSMNAGISLPTLLQICDDLYLIRAFQLLGFDYSLIRCYLSKTIMTFSEDPKNVIVQQEVMATVALFLTKIYP
jgi:hypothetical protein